MAKTAKKKVADYTLIQKRNKRFAIKGKDGKYINGEEKVKILLKEGKIKLAKAAKKEEAPAEEKAEEKTEEKTKE